MMKLGVCTMIVATMLLTACGKSDTSIEERLRPVRYVTVSDASVFRDRSFSGTSKSSRESRLSFKVSGTVTNVPVQIGQRLNAGDLIAEIDPASYVLQAQQAQATLVEAQANDRRAAANYERTKGLYANDNASLNDLESSRAQAESAKALVAAAGKALEIARLNVSYTRLTADTDCSIASLDIEVNENVSAGQQVAAVSCGDAFEVSMDLPESLISSVDENTPVSVRFGSIPDEVFAGVISEIAVASAPGSAAFPVVIQIDGTHPSLRSGLAADVTFQFESAADQKGGAVLPVSAVINDPDGTFVFVAEQAASADEAIVRRRPVTLGELSQSGIEILDGLQVGDRVITAGISVIRDGQRVLLPAPD
ncbi:MAG: efflux RND transporter periplasmic adaptor subunit [Gammaproteobacteria bacterium]|nr:efflux RND transporter periplasmic adaptor subunit [Gammaproteobacteria bacterium]MDH3433693.1 efflux RND transporter periplasmic adaptor subunit [Gammaproteobacteria bacterium]